LRVHQQCATDCDQVEFAPRIPYGIAESEEARPSCKRSGYQSSGVIVSLRANAGSTKTWQVAQYQQPPHNASSACYLLRVRQSGWNELQGGLRASFCTFPSTILETFRNDGVVDVNHAIRIQLVYFWTDLGTNPVAAACRLINDNL
jgi:hypothetical protein